MMTFRQFEARAATGDLDHSHGDRLVAGGTRRGDGQAAVVYAAIAAAPQSPAGDALIESAVSSNRIEGVEVDQARVTTLIFGQPVLRDRDEEEVRGYRDALNEIHSRGATLPVSQQAIQDLHRRLPGPNLGRGPL